MVTQEGANFARRTPSSPAGPDRVDLQTFRRGTPRQRSILDGDQFDSVSSRLQRARNQERLTLAAAPRALKIDKNYSHGREYTTLAAAPSSRRSLSST